VFDREVIYKRMRRYRMKGRLELYAPLSLETSFQIGGPADILFVPDNIAEAVQVVKLCHRDKIPLTVLGNGTNVLVRDGGVRGIVMKLEGLCELRRERSHIFAGAGAPLAAICAFARDEGLSGLEFAGGIPGTAGGAVYMNAGAYGGEMKDVVYRTVTLDPEGSVGLIGSTGHNFSYRYSVFQENNFIILETEFVLAPSAKSEISARMDDYNARRESGQPMNRPSAGSVFRRPDKEGYYVGPMIEECGLKGFKIGGAQVSEKHAGFIINSGGASAADVLDLIGLIKMKVKKRFSVSLATEIRIIGED